eukprot:TRINITY_DN62936_c0_g1_i1.p1 TRINITY_DN62936_c0_g1~~TRINITY_DN62936_c0_g1_i1.p1  ORF type:complete len:911 (-),score=60.48 TRINITY_DN62936_c0_g1_i1:279-3011(-)
MLVTWMGCLLLHGVSYRLKHHPLPSPSSHSPLMTKEWKRDLISSGANHSTERTTEGLSLVLTSKFGSESMTLVGPDLKEEGGTPDVCGSDFSRAGKPYFTVDMEASVPVSQSLSIGVRGDLSVQTDGAVDPNSSALLQPKPMSRRMDLAISASFTFFWFVSVTLEGSVSGSADNANSSARLIIYVGRALERMAWHWFDGWRHQYAKKKDTKLANMESVLVKFGIPFTDSIGVTHCTKKPCDKNQKIWRSELKGKFETLVRSVAEEILASTRDKFVTWHTTLSQASDHDVEARESVIRGIVSHVSRIRARARNLMSDQGDPHGPLDCATLPANSSNGAVCVVMSAFYQSARPRKYLIPFYDILAWKSGRGKAVVLGPATAVLLQPVLLPLRRLVTRIRAERDDKRRHLDKTSPSYQDKPSRLVVELENVSVNINSTTDAQSREIYVEVMISYESHDESARCFSSESFAPDAAKTTYTLSKPVRFVCELLPEADKTTIRFHVLQRQHNTESLYDHQFDRALANVYLKVDKSQASVERAPFYAPITSNQDAKSHQLVGADPKDLYKIAPDVAKIFVEGKVIATMKVVDLELQTSVGENAEETLPTDADAYLDHLHDALGIVGDQDAGIFYQDFNFQKGRQKLDEISDKPAVQLGCWPLQGSDEELEITIASSMVLNVKLDFLPPFSPIQIGAGASLSANNKLVFSTKKHHEQLCIEHGDAFSEIMTSFNMGLDIDMGRFSVSYSVTRVFTHGMTQQELSFTFPTALMSLNGTQPKDMWGVTRALSVYFGTMAMGMSAHYRDEQSAVNAKVNTTDITSIKDKLTPLVQQSLQGDGNAMIASVAALPGAETSQGTITAVVISDDNELSKPRVQVYLTLETRHDVSAFLPFEASVALYQVYDFGAWIMQWLCSGGE